MSTFFVLPTRAQVGELFANQLRTLLPGLDWNLAEQTNLAEAITAAAEMHADVHVVYRDDLPAGQPTLGSLIDGFGAEPGDELIEVRLGSEGPQSRRSRIGLRAA